MFLSSFSPLIDLYDVFFFDLWGVTHNGKQAFQGALRTFEEILRKNKIIIFLSNAPRRKNVAIDQLIERGVSRHLYHDIMTSGDLFFQTFSKEDNHEIKKFGHSFFHLGPEKDASLFHDLKNYKKVDLEKASFILNSGTHSFDDTIEEYIPLLQEGLRRNLPMVCPNPDQKVIYGDQFAICAGAIAKKYEMLGGSVKYYGKPYPEIFLKTLELCSKDVLLSKVLMIGDSLATDIKGANAAGIDSIFILSGIHQLKKEDDLNALFQKTFIQPTYFMEKVDLE